MTVDIPYKGFTSVPSDYDCADGQLAASLNLIHEDGALKPISRPSSGIQLRNEDERLLLVHKVPGRSNPNYIIVETRDGISQLKWVEGSAINTDGAKYIGAAPVPEIYDKAILGNTIILATAEGLRYFLWKDGDYKALGQKPPFVAIEFGMALCGNLGDASSAKDDEITIDRNLYDWEFDGDPGSGAYRPHAGQNKSYKEELADLTTKLYALLLPAVAEKVTTQGFFYQPFFVRYAYRLYDGSYCWHSAPVLMLPSATVPVITINSVAKGDDDGSTTKALCSLSRVNYFSLMHRVLDTGIQDLKDWEDVVAGIDVFVSAPLYTYDQSKDLEYRPACSFKSFMRGAGRYFGDEESWSQGQSRQHPSYGKTLIGHYSADSLAPRGRVPSTTADHFCDVFYDTESICEDDNVAVWKLPRNEHFLDNIRSCHDFYKYAEIDIKDIKHSDDMVAVKCKTKDLSSLISRQTLSDDYQSHAQILARNLFAYNNRLNMGDITLSPAQPFPIRSSVELSDASDSPVCANTIIKVWSRINGSRVLAVHDAATPADVLYNSAKACPRYVFYPDASAYKMEIFCSDSIKYILNLVPHDFLYGAYFFSTHGYDNPDNAVPEVEAGSSTTVDCYNKIYTSEANNPFVFPAVNINTVGNGRVLGLCSAIKALSQGQFGQFPLYAFTSEGVWALASSPSGSFVARQPVARDVCINPDGITQIDSAVLFPTSRGIMLLSGSQTTCVSDDVNSKTPFDVMTLQGMGKLHDMLGHSADEDCLRIHPFLESLQHCRMIYDYLHQRIIVYNPAYRYAYVYSLKSQSWGMMQSTIQYNVNSYPNALAVDASGLLLDFATTFEDYPKGVFVTRPLRLGAGSTLKTIDMAIQRGNFLRGHVQTVLYGSRDLQHWFPLWSSTDHYLRGFRGTPYKYFRFAGLTSLAPGESVTGATVNFEQRYNTKLR